jgi:formylglycine-generating enzyme required for sulfatase activity
MEAADYIVGEYKLETELGKSDHWAVYSARHQTSGEQVALRFLIPDSALSQTLLRRWEHSAANLRNLNHPGLVSVRDAGVYRGVPYLVVDYAAGQTLREKLQAPLPAEQAARLLTPVARALVYLHEHHLPHRNVHAANIMTGKGFILADSGVQQLLDLLEGRTPSTSDPVQEDLRGLAGVFLEMITGVWNEKGERWTSTRVRAALQKIQLPAEVVQLVQRALLVKGSYKSMQAFAQALEKIGRGVPQTPEARTSTASQRSPQSAGRKPRQKRNAAGWLIPLGLLVVAVIAVAVWLLPGLLTPDQPIAESEPPAGAVQPLASSTPVQEVAVQPSPQEQESETASPALQPSTTPQPTARPLDVGSVQVSAIDGMEMVYVPAGEFIMGANDREDDEKPQHNVYLDAFWVDRTEVTNSMYALCVQAGACKPPVSSISSKHSTYFGNPDFEAYPVIYVTWKQARDYCSWAGRRLPTEAEWEKAARGTKGYITPWGNNSPSPDQVNYNGNVGDTSQVGSYPKGASVYGTLDMAGNVWEWVADWYSSKAYTKAVYENPTGPQEGTRRVLRGGSWYYPLNDIRASNRFSASDNTTLNDVGFRCVLPAE